MSRRQNIWGHTGEDILYTVCIDCGLPMREHEFDEWGACPACKSHRELTTHVFVPDGCLFIAAWEKVPEIGPLSGV